MKSNAGSEARVLHSHLIHIDRHRLGPRFYLLGRRIHEWQLGAGVLALGVTARAVELIGDRMAALLVVAAAWLIAKDWQDLFASRRDTCGWRLGIHRRIAELRASRRGDWLPPLAAVAVGVVGLVNAVSTLTPNLGWEGHTLLHLEPVRFVPLFHALALPASAGLIVAAIYLGRRRRRAWHLAFSSLVAL